MVSNNYYRLGSGPGSIPFLKTRLPVPNHGTFTVFQ